MLKTPLATKFDGVSEWASSSYLYLTPLAVTCSISLLHPTVYSPLFPRSGWVECVSCVKSDSVRLMLWGCVCVCRGGLWRGVEQNDDQSSRCPFLLITHYCATDLCQNSSSVGMRTKASVNQEGYSSVWGHNPHTSSVPPTCLSDSWMCGPAEAEELTAEPKMNEEPHSAMSYTL